MQNGQQFSVGRTMNNRPESSFAVMSGVWWRMPRLSPEHVRFWRVIYRGLATWRSVRIARPLTRLLGPQYRRSRDLIEIDITYACNLRCHNCNRSVGHAPEARHMPVETVERFVDESIAVAKRWRRIRVLGGEPTLHPQFDAVVAALLQYRRWSSACVVEIVTNGYGVHAERALARLPEEVWVENSRKVGPVQPHFGPFNLAPCDDPAFRMADYSNGCAVQRDCGMGLTPLGYYPCAVAGGIDRILNKGFGVFSLPADDDEMLEAAAGLCRLCGRFRDGHFVPRALREPLSGDRVSPSWARLYREWRSARVETMSGVPRSAGEYTFEGATE